MTPKLVGQNFPDELPGIIDRVGKWAWDDGSAFTYINWKSDEPDYTKPSMMCIQMLTSNGEWIGVDCGAQAYGICEKASNEKIFKLRILFSHHKSFKVIDRVVKGCCV